jgi:hypothetical protein
MSKTEMIEMIFNTTIEANKTLENAKCEYGEQAPYTIGLQFAYVQSRELISKLNLDIEFYEYRSELDKRHRLASKYSEIINLIDGTDK